MSTTANPLVWGVFLVLATGVTSAWAEEKPATEEPVAALHLNAFEDDRGGFYVAWTHALPGGLYTLSIHHMSASGQSLWSESDSTSTLAIAPDQEWTAFADGLGGVTAAWARLGGISSFHRDSDGQSMWVIDHPVTISTAAIQNLTGVADASGGSYILWAENDFPHRYVLQVQHLDASGVPTWPAPGQRVSLRPSDQQQPAIVFDSGSGAIVAWNDKREQASQLQIQRFDFQADRLWGAQGLVITAPAGRFAPLLQPLAHSASAVAWSGTQAASTRIFLQSLSATGVAQWGPAGVGVGQGQGDQWNPVILGTSDGALWTAWEDYRSQIHWNVYLTRLDAKGQPSWPKTEMAVDPILADQGRVALADDGHRGVFVAWMDNSNVRPRLCLQHVDAEGGEWANPQVIAEGLKSPEKPTLVTLSKDRIAIVWTEHPHKNASAWRWALAGNPPEQAAQAFRCSRESSWYN